MNRKNFTLMIKTFSEVFEKSLNPYVIETYFDLFQEIPDSQVQSIIKKCLKKCKYFPRPADIFEQLDEGPERYIPTGKTILTPEQRAKHVASLKEIQDQLKDKFKMPETAKGG